MCLFLLFVMKDNGEAAVNVRNIFQMLPNRVTVEQRAAKNVVVRPEEDRIRRDARSRSTQMIRR